MCLHCLKNSLWRIKKFKPTNVLIHDAARPNFTIHLLKKLINSLKKNKASIPVISSKDSIKYKVKNQLFNLNRKNSYLTQTPQGFKFKDIYDLSINQKNILFCFKIFIGRLFFFINLDILQFH